MLARRWPIEAAVVAALYLAGELARGLARGDADTAERNAATIVHLERRLHVFAEPAIQRATQHVPALPTVLGYAYLGLHLAGTAAVLAWVYRRRRHAYRRVRNLLAVASGLAVLGYALFPAAPPRLAGVGIADTVSRATTVNLGSALVSGMYNPYAAFPSMHIGFAVIAGGALFVLSRRRLVRVAGLLYPLFVLFVIVATGNHFFADAAAGAAAAGGAVVLSAAASAGRAGVRVAAPAKA